MKKFIRALISVAVVFCLLSATVVSASASNWSSGGSNSNNWSNQNWINGGSNGWANQTWSYVYYGYNEDGQYYAKRYENGTLVQDIRARGNNLWNDTYQVLLSSWVSNRSSVDLAIDANGNVYGVDAYTNECICYDNGYDYPTRLTGYTVNVGTPFKFNDNGFVVGIYTSQGLVDMSGNLTYDTDSNYGNDGQPPIYGDGPGSNGQTPPPNLNNNGGFNGNGDFGRQEYPYVSPTNLSATTKTYYKSSSVYYTYTLSSGKLTFTKNGGSSKTTVYSSNVKAFAFTDDGYVNFVYSSGSYYYGVSIAVGYSSGSTKVFNKASGYVLNLDNNGFVIEFDAGNGSSSYYPYFSPTTKSSTTRTYYKSSSVYYKYTLSSGKLKFTKNGSSSTSTISTSYYEGSIVYFSFTDDGDVIFVSQYGGDYYCYLIGIGKTVVSDVIFEDSDSYSVTTDDDGFVTKIKSDYGTYTV